MFEKIKKKYWIYKERKRLIREINSNLFILSYMKSIREKDIMRSNFGLKDLSVRKLEGLCNTNDMVMGSSRHTSLYSIYFYLLELKKLSKLAKKNFITEDMLKSFFKVANKPFDNSLSIYKMKDIIQFETNKDDFDSHVYKKYSGYDFAYKKKENKKRKNTYETSCYDSNKKLREEQENTTRSMLLTTTMLSAVG